jgi:hypothetical protein
VKGTPGFSLALMCRTRISTATCKAGSMQPFFLALQAQPVRENCSIQHTVTFNTCVMVEPAWARLRICVHTPPGNEDHRSQRLQRWHDLHWRIRCSGALMALHRQFRKYYIY